MLTHPALRIVASAVALSAGLLCAPMAASAASTQFPNSNNRTSEWSSGVHAKALSLPKPDLRQTGREGSVGVGSLRLFINRPVTSTSTAGGLQQTATSRSRGIAWIPAKPKADGTFRVAGQANTYWQSQTTAPSGGTKIIMNGRTEQLFKSSWTPFSARTAGKNPIFAQGSEEKGTSWRKGTQGSWHSGDQKNAWAFQGSFHRQGNKVRYLDQSDRKIGGYKLHDKSAP